jgi:hypothetical protein
MRQRLAVLPGSLGAYRPGRRYRGAVDVKRAADLYAQGRSLRQIGAELGVHWSTVSQQLQKAGLTMRRGTPSPRIRLWSCVTTA